ncbi:MAG TPA: hypothetical protein VGM51_14095 [Armatimonadota bacterium]
MSLHRFSVAALCVAGLLTCRTASATTIAHTNQSDFQTGISDGIVQVMQETTTGTPPSGAVGVMPALGASIINDDFNYTTVAGASANYLFLTPNTADHAELATFPSQFLFSADTPTAPEATAPAAGALRLHCSRNQDFFNTGLPGQKSPMFAINKKILTGDWVAETKFTIAQDRATNNQRVDGIYIGQPAAGDVGQATDVPLDNTTLYIVAGVTVDPVARAISRSRIYPNVNGYPLNYTSTSFPGQTWYVRVVKRGAYFFTYVKNSDASPWVFHQWFKNPNLAAGPGLVVGPVAISWGGTNPSAAQYQDDDFDYLKVNQIGAMAGSFTNVFDAGLAADWQTVALNTNFKETLKYQLRAGNTLAAGTLTDAGSFVGPDGTSSTFFTDDAAQVAPNATGKRYLEYKLFMDAATPPAGNDTINPANLPAFLRSISATFHPAGLTATLLSSGPEFGADAGGIQTQSGNGDVSLKRTEVFRDDFASTVLDPAWTFDSGYTLLDPTVVGDYSLTERPGYFRMKVGWPQDYYTGTIKFGGVKLLRNIPAGVDVNNFEIETEVNLETQQSRFAALEMWMGPNDFMGIGLARRFSDTYDVGPVEDTVLNNLGPGPVTYNYGSNTLQLRVTKLGTVVTLSFRDPDSASPSWRVLAYRDTKGMATGGADFVPVQIGFLGKSYDLADEAPINYDYNYLSVSNLTPAGQKDFTITIPAGSHPDALVSFADGSNTSNMKAQVQGPGGTFVGPDGTAGTFFTANEPKIPAALDGVTTPNLRLFLGGATSSAVPVIHAAGIQYATASSRVVRDTNAADFAAATVKNGIDMTTIPGVVTPTVGTGTPVTENFSASTTGWLFSNTPPGTSTYSFTENPGWARVNATAPCDTWSPGTSLEKPRIILYNATPVTGDFELETYVSFPNGRDTDRNQGLAIIQTATGPTPDASLDMTNLIAYGPYRQDAIFMLHADNNVYGDGGVGGYTDTAYYLRLRKTGNVFSGSVSTDGVTYTPTTSFTLSHSMPGMYVGFFAKTWNQASGTQPIDYDYFKFSPLTTTGVIESRVLDMGVSGLTLISDTLGGNSTAAKLQYRAADTLGALAALPYLGPDGTSGTTYAATSSSILTGVAGRYVQYKATIPAGSQISDVAVYGSAAVTVPLSRQDAVNALRVAGGLQTAVSADMLRLDVVKGTSAGIIGLEDAVSILRKVSGL